MLTEEKGIQYGYDKNARKIQAKNGEPIYGLKNGTPFLEIICPNYEELKYNEKDHVFEKVPAGTEMFHLDADKNRDSRTAPYTGMAYVEADDGRIMAVSYTHLTATAIMQIGKEMPGGFTITGQKGNFILTKRILIWLPVNQLITAHMGMLRGTELSLIHI